MMFEEEPPKCDCRPGAPMWTTTFADLMALLLCFFVLLLSYSELDAQKFKRIAGSMAQAFGVQNAVEFHEIPRGTSVIAQEFSPAVPQPTPLNQIWQKTENSSKNTLEVSCAEEYDKKQKEENLEAGVRARITEKLQELIRQTQQDAEEISRALHEQIVRGEVEVETEGRKIVIRIREKGSFDTASAELNEGYYDALDEIREVLRDKPGKILVEGHTDHLPISTPRFRSNWELSSARAVSVAEVLLRDNMNPRRFTVSGYAETVPLGDNATAAGRALNRRVEIVIQQGLEHQLDQQDIRVLQEQGQDILRDLDLDPGYLFDLKPEEIF